VLAVAPGVAVHELGHLLLCRLSGVPVRQVVLFRVGSPAGFVSHAAPRLLRQQVAIAGGPLLVSSFLAAALFAAAARLALAHPGPWWPAGALVGLWLGWSIGVEAWPSTGDASALRRLAVQQLRRLNPAAMPALLLGWTLACANASRRFRGHWLYAALLMAVGLRLAGLFR
jgi:hypothetical protein